MAVQDPTREITVLIVDDHAIIRRGLRELVKGHYPSANLLETSCALKILPLLEQTPVDLVLLDLQLTDGNSIDLVGPITQQGARVLVYSMSSERIYAQQAMARGASGFLSKAMDEEELLHAMDRVLAGGTYLSPEMEQATKQRDRDRDPLNDLSDRELRVMGELLTGAGVKEIAVRMDLQPTTVATYKARLFDKLGVSNVLDLQLLVSARKPKGHPDKP